ncbi:retrovirus-related pol polyprotein from transposon TNT 1-94 [Tanacetum coccineum]
MIQPTLYDGSVIAKEHAVISVIDDEETLILEEQSRSKMLDKQNDPISIEKKINISPIDYSKLNKIKEDFGKCFVTKKELSAEQAFWLKHSSFSETPVTSHTPVRIEAPRELPKELLVYASQTYPNSPKPSEKLVAVTPMNKDKRVRFAKHVTYSSNIPKQADSLKIKDSNKHLLTSTGVKPTTSASGSKPSGRTFTIVGNRCPLTRITSSKVVPTKETSTKSVATQTKGILVYSRRPKTTRYVGSTGKVVQIVLWYLDSGCLKHMTENRSQLINFVSKFLGTVRFGNDHIAKIMVYEDYQMGNVIISRVYYVEGLGHNLFSVGQFCDSDLEVAFHKHTCFIHDLDGVHLLKGSRGSNLDTLSMDNLLLSSTICLLFKASNTKSWLWHRRLSHLNFDYINSLAKQGLVRELLKLKYQKDHLCFACALGKRKKHSHKPKAEDSIQEKLYLLHMDLCGPIKVQSINGRKYILVIIDDFSRFTWVKFLRSKDEVLEFIIKFLKMIQVRLNATVHNIRTDNGTEFVNHTLKAYYEEVGISHQTYMACTP